MRNLDASSVKSTIVSSIRLRTVLHTLANSHCGYLIEIKTVKILAWTRGAFVSPSLVELLLSVDGSWG